MGSIVLGLATGDLTPQEALRVAKLVESFSTTLSTAELERELRELAKGLP
jgi:hypothetical protein